MNKNKSEYVDTDIAFENYKYRVNNLESWVFRTYSEYPENEIKEQIDKYLKDYIMNTINVVRYYDHLIVVLTGTKRKVKLK